MTSHIFTAGKPHIHSTTMKFTYFTSNTNIDTDTVGDRVIAHLRLLVTNSLLSFKKECYVYYSLTACEKRRKRKEEKGARRESLNIHLWVCPCVFAAARAALAEVDVRKQVLEQSAQLPKK